jgi:enhancing lycopene biosynthesis protein 2
MSVTGGGLQRSNIGSSDALSSCRVFSGARIAQVVMELCASKISTGRWFFFSPSGIVVDHIYALRSSLPQIMCPVSSAKVALI